MVSAPAYFDQFAVGMLLALALEATAGCAKTVREEVFVPVVAVALAVVAQRFFYGLGPPTPYSAGSGVLYAPVMALAFALVVATMARGHRLQLFFLWRPLVLLGTISYGIYLWHMLFVQILWAHGLGASHGRLFVIDLVIVFAATVAAASCSWLLVERRLLPTRVSERRTVRKIQARALRCRRPSS